MPPAAFTPQVAVEHLGALSSEIRAAVLFNERGELAAHTDGDAERAARMREVTLELFEHAARAPRHEGAEVAQVEVATADGTVFALRDPRAQAGAGWTVAVVARRSALPSLVFYDLLRVLAELAPEGG